MNQVANAIIERAITPIPIPIPWLQIERREFNLEEGKNDLPDTALFFGQTPMGWGLLLRHDSDIIFVPQTLLIIKMRETAIMQAVAR